MVAPGSTPTPEVITRVGIPSVWLSTAPKTFCARITPPFSVLPSAPAVAELPDRYRD
jgi:hypothetical protein